MNYYIKDPIDISSFYPIALNRPLYDIVVGCMTLKRRLSAGVDAEVKGISATFNQNEEKLEGYVFSSQVVWNIHQVRSLLAPNKVVKTAEGEIVFFYADGLPVQDLKDPKKIKEYVSRIEGLEEISLETEENTHSYGVLKHIADVFLYHKDLLEEDLLSYVHDSVSTRFKLSGDPLEYYNVSGDPIRFFAKKTAEIASQVVINVSKGSVVIEDNAQIGSFSYIEGPCFIGKNVVIDQAKIRAGSVILDSCKIGGEVEESIFMPFSNKHHEGFVGHSYVGQFVNLGALTTTSDLKNNYSFVNCQFNGQHYLTRQLKIGSFIGDYCTLGIGTLLNTGTMIGLGSNLFGGNNILKYKAISSFTWKEPENNERYKIDQLIKTIKVMMERRGQILSLEEEKLMRDLYQKGESL